MNGTEIWRRIGRERIFVASRFGALFFYAFWLVFV